MLTVHEITTYRVPYPDRIERDAESIGGATRAMRLGRPALHRAPHPDRVYWTTEEYQRDYSARSALALGLWILRAQRREIAHAGSPTCGCEPREPIGNAVFCRRCGTCLAVSD